VTDIQEIGMSLPPPIKVGKLQTALHTKAKNSPGYRFYALYDKLYRRDILKWAFLRCLHNGGKPGVDGQSFADIEAYGEERWLDELTEELRNETISWVTPLAGTTTAGRASPTWDRVRRGRKSTGSAGRLVS
jgi:hypothetical protein